MANQQPWYVGQRAEHLAVMFFTRLQNVSITPVAQEYAVDFLVNIGGGMAAGRIFGVAVKGSKHMRSLAHSDGLLLRPVFRDLRRLVRDYTFPIGILAVDVSTAAARFGWVLAPTITPFGTARLQLQEDVNTAVVSNETLSEAVKEVSAWYNAGISHAGVG